MKGAAKRLTRKNAHRQALHYAINERDSYAEAYGGDGPEAARARWLADEFRRVLWEEFGEKTSEDRLAEASEGSFVSVEEIVGRRP